VKQRADGAVELPLARLDALRCSTTLLEAMRDRTILCTRQAEEGPRRRSERAEDSREHVSTFSAPHLGWRETSRSVSEVSAEYASRCGFLCSSLFVIVGAQWQRSPYDSEEGRIKDTLDNYHWISLAFQQVASAIAMECEYAGAREQPVN